MATEAQPIPSPRRRDQHATLARALTLIEVIVAIVIISIAVPPVMVAMKDSATRLVDPIQTDRARWLASEKLEDLIADRHSTTRGYAYLVSANYPAENTITGFPGFSRTVSLAETGVALSGAGTGYKTATVTVTWRDSRGLSRSLAVATAITDY